MKTFAITGPAFLINKSGLLFWFGVTFATFWHGVDIFRSLFFFLIGDGFEVIFFDFDSGEKRWYRFLGGNLMLLGLMAFLVNIKSFLYWIGFVKKYSSLLSEFVEGDISAFDFAHRFQDSYRKEGRLILISRGFSGILERLALDVDNYLGSIHQRESRNLIDKVLLSRAKEALANVEAGVARRSIYGSPNR